MTYSLSDLRVLILRGLDLTLLEMIDNKVITLYKAITTYNAKTRYKARLSRSEQSSILFM